MRTTMSFALFAASLIFSTFAQPAFAQRDRVFVASYGSDSNPCTFGSPCKTFQHAHDTVAANGEITAIDSAGFGPFTINKAVTVTSPASVESGIAVAMGGNGITINAGTTDVVQIHGLTIDGATIGYNGIVLNSAGSLTITDCTLENFAFDGVNFTTTGNGILMRPTGSNFFNFAITNTAASNNGTDGILYSPPSGSPTVKGAMDHVVTTANSNGGIVISAQNATGGSAVVTISNSIASGGTGPAFGIFVGGTAASPVKASIDNVSVSGNLDGIGASGTANVLLGRSVITGNTTGISNQTSPNTFFTYGDNRIDLNTTDIVVGGGANEPTTKPLH
jgi:hypothetical protein